jgi:hypothetical protein
MMISHPSLTAMLSRPAPDSLWLLRADLLESGLDPDSRPLAILDAFYHFLNRLVASSTAREYSHFASILDMAALAGVAVQNLIDEEDSEDWWRRFVVGAISEGMMVLAARQYVKAWEEEMRAGRNTAAWYLAQEYWSLSVDLQPALPSGKRRQLVEQLFAPIADDQVDGTVKAGLLVRLFQILLLVRLQMPSP